VGTLTPATFTATAIAGPAAALAKVRGDGQSAPAGTSPAESLVVRVADGFGNGVSGATVNWAVTGGGGSVSAASTTTGPDGQAAIRVTVGTAVGFNTVSASAAGLPAVGFAVSGTAGPVALLEKVSGDNQTGGITAPVADSLVVRVTDQYGNPVSGVTVDWAAAPGNGSVSPASMVSRTNGEARTRWTLGAGLGPQSASATVTSLGPALFGANAVASTFNLTIGGMYITQATQTLSRSVPLIAGRAGYLRVWVVGTEVRDDLAPKVRVRWYQGAALVRTDTLLMPGSQVEIAVAESPLGTSWNLPVPGTLIQPGLEIEVDADPENLVEEINESDNALPASGRLVLDVRSASPLNVTLVPVLQVPNGQTGNVTAGNKDTYLVTTQKIFPLETISSNVHTVYSTNTVLESPGAGWSALLGEINALRVAEASNNHYLGIVHVTYTSGVAGIGYVPGRATLSWDHMPSGDGVSAHELGHNLSRFHSPCGNPSGIDQNYPYPGGVIGVFGMDVATATLMGTGMTDIMGYCNNQWVSDYTYLGVLNHRAANPLVAGGNGPREPALLVWGRIENGALVLEPAFPVTTRPVLPAEPGPYRLDGLDAGGGTLFSLSFSGEEVADLPNQRSFAFAIPAATARMDRLAALRLSDGARSVEVRPTALAAAGVTPPEPTTLRAEAGGRARLRWSAAAYPMALVRDPGTGAVLSFARGGDAVVTARAGDVEVILSDGVRGVSQRMTVAR
jgi:hypothetical protein